jgi:glycosyltransferase involved in cell wall biosynthesis
MTRMKPRIAFVINSIGAGGAERVLGHLLRTGETRADPCEIHLILLDREPEMRQLTGFTTKHVLDGRGRFGRSAMQLRGCLRRIAPDLVVSLLVRANVATVAATRNMPAKTILCERMHLGSHLAGRYRGARLAATRLLPRLLYRRADMVLGVSEGVRRNLVAEFGVPKDRTRTIHNPYDIEQIVADGAREPSIALPDDFVVAVGRLVAAKNFAMLIDAYKAARIDPALVILGEGPERPALERQIARSGLQDRILLPGFVENPFAIVRRARFLASASRNEGFPNGIAEAMALGRPIVSTDCPSGPAELLGGKAAATGEVVEARYGLLVADNDLGGMTIALQRMDEPALRSHYSAAARERIQHFRIQQVASEYWSLFDEMLPPRPFA